MISKIPGRIIHLAAIISIIVLTLFSGISGCHKTASEREFHVVKQAWDIILDDYVDRDSLDTNLMSQDAIEGLFVPLDNPETTENETDRYIRALSQVKEQGLERLDKAWLMASSEYIERADLEINDMTRAAITGMLASLDDPYSSYLEAEQYELGMSKLEGEFGGIGTYIGVEDRQLRVIAPIADSPAEKAGIRAGDTILEVDGEPVSEMSLAEAIIKIRGPEGTEVRLLVLHEGEPEPELISIIRTIVEVPSVRFEMKREIAYIQITEFTVRTSNEIGNTLQNLTGENASGIILDLRNNPGGLLDQVIYVASYFLTEGTIVQTKDNQGKIMELRAQTQALTTDLPIVVLVNDASASGSEVLSGALQDHGRAIIAGSQTYGKGSVNVLYELDDGSGLYLTIGRWLTPDGNLIEGKGIEPDYPLELTGEDAVQWAIDYLTGSE